MADVPKNETSGGEITRSDIAAQGDRPLTRRADVPSNIIQVGQQQIDISHLPQEIQNQLQVEAARKMMDQGDRAIRLQQDVVVLGQSLQSMTNAASAATEAGSSITTTNTRDDNLGRTETIIGNTETAHRGKLTRSQTGGFGNLSNQALFLIGALILAVTIIVIVIASR